MEQQPLVVLGVIHTFPDRPSQIILLQEIRIQMLLLRLVEVAAAVETGLQLIQQQQVGLVVVAADSQIQVGRRETLRQLHQAKEIAAELLQQMVTEEAVVVAQVQWAAQEALRLAVQGVQEQRPLFQVHR